MDEMEGRDIDQRAFRKREALFRAAMEHLDMGIQIYDREGTAVYFNAFTRRLSGIPEDRQIEGRHLMELYEEDEGNSTVLSAMRTGKPVRNRVDHFRSADGMEMTTVNTSYPIFLHREVIGAVNFDHNIDSAALVIRELTDTRRALQEFDKKEEEIQVRGYRFEDIIGSSAQVRRSVQLARKAASGDGSVLLVGETGTGKEVYAQSIHQASSRSGSGRFIALNCAAVPEALIESTLFGTVKGSFTGSENRSGYLEQADQGTLFLDEVNSMSLAMQSKLLRFLQEGSYRRVGGQEDLHADVRIIASCNEDPFQAIEANRMRSDLFYRISTMMIELAPLREHPEDLEELIRHHMKTTSFRYVHAFTGIASEALDILYRHHWPGNVRELFHVLDYAQNVAESSIMVPEYLPDYLLKQAGFGRWKHAAAEHTAVKYAETGAQAAVRKAEAVGKQNTSGAELPEQRSARDAFLTGVDWENGQASLQFLMDQFEERTLRQALEHFGGNMTKTAKALGLRRQSLQYRVKKFGIVV